MKRMTVILVGTLLMLGGIVAPACAETSGEESVAMLANDAGLKLEGLRRDTSLFYEQPRASVVAEGDKETDAGPLLTCHFTDGCGFAVNPQVKIDLQYQLVEVEEAERSIARNGFLGERFSPNVTLGLHINF